MKKILAILAVVTSLVAPMGAERINAQYTITAGTPIRVATQKTLANRLFIQSRHNNTGLVYVLMGVKPTTTCDATNTAHLSAELGPGDATHPGSSLSDPQGANGGTPPDAEDVSWLCLDGSHTGDVVIVSFWRRN